MPSTNAHRRAVLYARVSTDEQARSGYSLAQQLEAFREYAAREGYEVLEEVSDPGQSGASLERPGMDRVQDIVAAGGVSVVLAQDRDRIGRAAGRRRTACSRTARWRRSTTRARRPSAASAWRPGAPTHQARGACLTSLSDSYSPYSGE
jgi:predicted site-specific integrase-resolvase